jgi:hypothetical protein
MNEIFDVLAAQSLLLVAVAVSPGLQPLLGSRHRYFPLDTGIRDGQRVQKQLALNQQLWRDSYARVVQMQPHCAVVHRAPHVSRT